METTREATSNSGHEREPLAIQDTRGSHQKLHQMELPIPVATRGLSFNRAINEVLVQG